MIIFSKKLREILKEKKITQKELANVLGTTQQTVSRWLKDINEPDLTSLTIICKILNVSADYLLGLEDDFGQKKYNIESINNSNINSFNNNNGTINFKP